MNFKTEFFICFAILFVLGHGKKYHDGNEVFNAVHNECQSNPATSVNKDVLAKLQNGEKVDDANLGQYIFCINRKLNIQEKNGDINKDTIRSRLNIHYNENYTNDIIKECTSTTQGDTKIDLALNLFQCLSNNKHFVEVYHVKNEIERSEDYAKADQECQSDPATTADKTEITKLRHAEDIDSVKLRKFIFCMSKKVNILDENAVLNKDVVRADLRIFFFSDTKIEDIIKECTINSESKEATALKTFKCLQKYWHQDMVVERNRLFKKIHDDCQSDQATKVDEDVLKQFKNDEKVNDPQLLKYFFCVSKKLGIQDENGEFNKETIIRYLRISIGHPNYVTETVDECGVKNEGDTAEEAAVRFFRCIHHPRRETNRH